jgi:DnaJ-class molecular chaperone
MGKNDHETIVAKKCKDCGGSGKGTLPNTICHTCGGSGQTITVIHKR